MVEVINSFGEMKNKRAVVKVDLYENFESIRTEEIENKSESYANSLAENWALDILQ